MDRLMDDFSRATCNMKVHKRTAGNIREQLLIIARSHEDEDNKSLDTLFFSLKSAIQKFQSLSQLVPLQTYLRQDEISALLDSLLDACYKYALTSNDAFVQEDIEAQREMYKSDNEADRINIKRMLRDFVRRSDVRQQVSKLTLEETSALRGAISLELKSLTDTGPDSQSAQVYKDFLARLDLGDSWLRQSQRPTVIQDLTGKITKISNHPVAWGPVCAVWKGELYGKHVSLHSVPSPYAAERLGDIEGRAYTEDNVLQNVMTWASFTHPHVLPLLGFCKILDGHRLALVSPWMKNTSVTNFVGTNAGADRLKLIIEIATGLSYLHSRSPPYVHNLLTGTGFLVNEDGQAVIGGFASAAFVKGLTSSLRWRAPEVLDRGASALTTASDVYGFAMTVFQIVAGSTPFREIQSPAKIVELIERGERPNRPDGKLVHHGLDDRLWSLLSRCWTHDPKDRPSMTEVLKEPDRMRELPALDVRDLTGLITIDEDSIFDVRACGAFGDIRVGLLEGMGPVALKTLNIRGRAQPMLRNTKRFYREASIWNELRHSNILPFLGTADPPGLSTCLVSPWIQNGNLIEYIKKHKDEASLHIARGITRGLAYLHAHKPHPVIHGDLRAANVLISDTGKPLLCDFGLAVVIEDLAQMPISSVLQDAGNPRWMAPELFVGNQHVTTASDIWALGMVLLEMMTLDVPYCELKSSAQVIVEVHKGRLPCRPVDESVSRRGFSGEVWELMMKCWAQNAGDRPSSADVLGAIESLTSDTAE